MTSTRAGHLRDHTLCFEHLPLPPTDAWVFLRKPECASAPDESAVGAWTTRYVASDHGGTVRGDLPTARAVWAQVQAAGFRRHQ